MEKLSSEHEALVQMMTSDDESARQGFELLVEYSDPGLFFDALKAAGFFNPHNSPKIVPAPEPGYVQVPYWSALQYVRAAAKASGEKPDTALANKVMAVVRAVTNFREENGQPRDNHHTYRVFAEILGLVPPDVITKSDIDLIPVWLNSKYNMGTIGSALNKGIIAKLLKRGRAADLDLACQILKYCTAVRRVDPGKSRSRGEYTTVVDSYWLKELVHRHIHDFAAKAPGRTSSIFIERLKEIFDSEDRDKLSYIWRPAIEDHAQNQSWNEPENIFVEALRDTLLSWLDREPAVGFPVLFSFVRKKRQICRPTAV